MTKQKTTIVLSLLAMYLIWGSTYLGIRLAIASIPPLLMTSMRLLLAGSLLFLFLVIRRQSLPSWRQWRNALIVGGLMLGGGLGGTTFAEQWVESGLAAVLVATVPLWATLMVGVSEKWPSRQEWVGIAVGLVGVVLLNAEDNLRANPLGAVLMLAAPISWAFGSMLSRRLDIAKGSMGFASEMLMGSAVLLVLALVRGERLTAVPTTQSIVAWLYLAIFGSLIAFSAYMYLLQTVNITLATSYAYVNPVVAVLLGVLVAGETISGLGMVAIAIILSAVVIITFAQRRPSAKTKEREREERRPLPEPLQGEQ
ncbi:MAG: drug/metabolite exporter YedA [Ardenticatenaceae bacterium]|nr:drug/metabolite exporter YedA [Ardenticatenaceae bacterium]